ncbi:MAG: GatB/YqeY domain-containing protein [Legionellales bacterium]|nr:GatB/YqeY domain-containing protein [Legionellales bacterium]
MTLKQRINDDVKAALKARDTDRLSILRMIMAAVKQIEVDERIAVDDERLITILTKMVKEQRDALDKFQAGHRDDLVAKAQAEIAIIQTYLPEPLSESEILAIIDKALAETQAVAVKDMGKVMGMVKPQVQGRADMGKISQLIKQRLPQ